VSPVGARLCLAPSISTGSTCREHLFRASIEKEIAALKVVSLQKPHRLLSYPHILKFFFTFVSKTGT
jgi:hypothetical protein